MAYQIVWTDEANISFAEIIAYIQKDFGEAALIKYITAVNAKILLIGDSPTSYRKSDYGVNIYYTNILRKTILVYRFDEGNKVVELIHFWDARRNPSRFGV